MLWIVSQSSNNRFPNAFQFSSGRVNCDNIFDNCYCELWKPSLPVFNSPKILSMMYKFDASSCCKLVPLTMKRRTTTKNITIWLYWWPKNYTLILTNIMNWPNYIIQFILIVYMVADIFDNNKFHIEIGQSEKPDFQCNHQKNLLLNMLWCGWIFIDYCETELDVSIKYSIVDMIAF